MPLAGFEPSIPASDRQQTYALIRAATGIGELGPLLAKINYAYTSLIMCVTNKTSCCLALEACFE
jgi:hypothetical protein